MAPQPVWKLELSEKDLKEAVASWASKTYNVRAEAKDVQFDIRQAYDSMDQRECTSAGINKATITLSGGGAPNNGQPTMRGGDGLERGA